MAALEHAADALVATAGSAGGILLLTDRALSAPRIALPDLLAVAVDRERFAGKGIMNDERDELLGEVVGPVVVGAVGCENR